MGSEIGSEMMTLQERALKILEHPERYAGMPDIPLDCIRVRMWCYPALSAYGVWVLWAQAGKHSVRRVEWDRLAGRGKAPLPVTYGSHGCVSDAVAESLLARLRVLPAPPRVRDTRRMVDGVHYGIASPEFCGFSQVEWRDPPAEWAPFSQWFEVALACFEAVLPRSTCRSEEIWNKP